MAAGKTKSMGEIDDIREMFQLMVALGIPSKGLKSLEDMKTGRVKSTIGQSSKPPSWNAGQVTMTAF